MKLTFDTNILDVTSTGKTHTINLDGQTYQAEVLRTENGQLDLLINGQRVTAYISTDGAKRWVTVNGQTVMLTRSTGAKRSGHRHDQAGKLAAPMPGQVRNVAVSVGEAVKQGQTLLTVEAMKMEIRIQAPRDGIVKALHVQQGQTVEREQILIEVEE